MYITEKHMEIVLNKIAETLEVIIDRLEEKSLPTKKPTMAEFIKQTSKRLKKLQNVIDVFWDNYENPMAYSKPTIEIVDVFDKIGKSLVSKDMQDFKCYQITRSEYTDIDCDSEEYEQCETEDVLVQMVCTTEVCFRLPISATKYDLLNELKQYFK